MDFSKQVGEAITSNEHLACSITDVNGVYRFVNKAFLELYGFEEDQILKQSISNVLDEAGTQKALKAHRDFLEYDISPDQSWNVYSKDGELIRVTTVSSKIYVDDTPYMFTITIRLNPTQVVEGSKFHKYEPSNVPKTNSRVGLYTYYPMRQSYDWSDGMYDIYQQPKDKGPMVVEEQIKLMDEQDLANLDTLIKKALQDDKPFDYVYSINLNGQHKALRLHAYRELMDDEPILTGVVIDVTGEEQRELELQKAQQLNKLAIEGGSIGIWELDLATGATNFNPMWYKMLGYDKEDIEFSVDFFESILHPEDKEIPFIEMDEYLSGRKDTYEIVIRLKAKNGSYRYVYDKASIVEWDADGKPSKLAGSHIDITEQKHAEHRLKESEHRYRFLTESLPHILWTGDEYGELNYCNQYGLDYLGADQSDIATWNWVQYIHEDDIDDVIEKFSVCVANGAPYINLQRLKSAEGEFRWFRVTAYPLKDNDGKTISWVGLSTDVHEAKSASESLEVTNNRLRSLIDASPIAIYSINPDGIVTDFWNPAAEELFGWKKEDTIGKFLPHVKEDNQLEFKKLIGRINDGQKIIRRRIIREDIQGNPIHIELTAGPVTNKDGEISEILILTSDVSELEEKRMKVESSLKEKETLLQEIHHRVKNNLAVISGLLHLQAFSTEDEIQKVNFTDAQNRIQTIATVHELLYKAQDFSRVNLSNYYDKLVELIETNLNFDTKTLNRDFNVEVEYFNINQAIPLGLLLNELLTNSIKHAFSNGNSDKRLKIEMTQSGDEITFIYEDNGPGFDVDKMELKKTVGWELIKTLISQLEAKSEIDTRDRFFIKLNFKNSLEARGAYSNMLIG